MIEFIPFSLPLWLLSLLDFFFLPWLFPSVLTYLLTYLITYFSLLSHFYTFSFISSFLCLFPSFEISEFIVFQVKSNTVYEIIRLLGRGSFGDVNLVKIVEDNSLYAMKTIFTEREVDMKDTLREVRFLRQNRHPCIIDVYDGFMTSQPRMLYIVMPYCEGGDLDTVLRIAKKNKTQIAEEKILRWVIQIGLGMHFIHENSFVHRDLKPNNIMLLDGGDLIKIVDFGLALNMKEVSI